MPGVWKSDIVAVTLNQLNQLKAASNVLDRSLSSDIRRLSLSLDGASPVSARDALLDVAPRLTQVYSEQSAVAAAEWYEGVRRAEVGGEYFARLGTLPATSWVEDDVRWAAEHLFSDYPGQTFIDLGKALSRKVLDAGRDTINVNTTVHDPRAAGWQRIARPTACDFCIMLAGRGGVYKRATADFASHNNCDCTARPSWDDSLPEVDVKLYEVSKRTGGMDAKEKAYYKTNIARWMADNQGELESYREAMANIT